MTRANGSGRWHVITLVTLACLVFVVTLVAFGILGGGSPTLTAPAPLLLFIAYAFIGPVAFAIPAILFVCWSWPLSRGHPVFPVRSLVLIVVLLVLSVAWHLRGGWRHYYGLGMAYIWLS